VTAVDYCPETMAIFDELWDARLDRVDAQLERITKSSYWLGRQLGRHEVTRADVDRRLAALCARRPIDDDAWCPWHLARPAAIEGLRQGTGAS
jgi:hypothetical protein